MLENKNVGKSKLLGDQKCWEAKNVRSTKVILLSTPSPLSADCGLFITGALAWDKILNHVKLAWLITAGLIFYIFAIILLR